MKKILILIFTLLLTGCFNYTELNKMAIVSSVGIDKNEDGYIVSAQVLNSKNKDDEEGSQVTVYTEKGKTIFEALRKVTLKSPKKLYGGHLEKLVLSKEVAENSIIDVIDSFERISNIKNEFNIVILEEGNAYDVLKILTTTENVPAEYVRHTIDTASKYSSLTYSTKLDEFLSLYLKRGIDPVLPIIKVNDFSKEGTTLDNVNTTYPISQIRTIEKIGLTHDGKIVDYLSKNEVIGYNILHKGTNTVVIPIKCDSKNYATITLKVKTKYKVKKKSEKEYTITYNLKSEGIIDEYNCDKNLNNEKNMQALEKKIKKKIENYTNEVIKKEEDSESEFLGLKNKVYLYNSKFKDGKINVEVNIKVDLPKKGQTRNSIKGAKNNEE